MQFHSFVRYESSDGHTVTLNEEKLREQLKHGKKYPDLFISNNKSKEYSEKATFGLYRVWACSNSLLLSFY
jgi:hypothetical protein